MTVPAHPGRTLFVNLPVADVEHSRAFFAASPKHPTPHPWLRRRLGCLIADVEIAERGRAAVGGEIDGRLGLVAGDNTPGVECHKPGERIGRIRVRTPARSR